MRVRKQFEIEGGLVVNGVEIVNYLGNVVAPDVATALSELSDVDLSALVDKGLLMYDAGAGTWQVTKQLDNHNLDAGQY